MIKEERERLDKLIGLTIESIESRDDEFILKLSNCQVVNFGGAPCGHVNSSSYITFGKDGINEIIADD